MNGERLPRARKNSLLFEINSLLLEKSSLFLEAKFPAFRTEAAVGDTVRSMSAMRRGDGGARSAPRLSRS